MEPNRATGAPADWARPAPSRRYGTVGAVALLAGALGYIALADPHNTTSLYPACPFKFLTGWDCPACGGLRMTHDLLHADLMAAVNDNVFLLVGLPLVAGWVLLRRRLGRSMLPTAALAVVVVTTIAWTVLRNLPSFPLVPSISG
ncbi:DUF2752 domain-containing protein [Mycobacterium spongiae]|uniref:DUF2752 domain-containing protein n=1 Tax=Mycobacterium spongiae TaxID=886343 RepID=A0A975JXW3_9MYCO|nr:DUF2752 domain-containing protein [Mycobacterium spongiae]QUR67398.1 DUF2752 domain-containing protein [Mycobacterium spongiae]